MRTDISRETVCRQIALAIRDEVVELEAAGIAIIQIDELNRAGFVGDSSC